MVLEPESTGSDSDGAHEHYQAAVLGGGISIPTM